MIKTEPYYIIIKNVVAQTAKDDAFYENTQEHCDDDKVDNYFSTKYTKTNILCVLMNKFME